MERHQRRTQTKNQERNEPPQAHDPLNTEFFGGHESQPINPHAPPQAPFSHWLSVEQIRIMQRMRRETVIRAMENGELPYERRGRIRYARLADVLRWEEGRLSQVTAPSVRRIDPDLEYLAG